jgi:hypothetical protein
VSVCGRKAGTALVASHSALHFLSPSCQFNTAVEMRRSGRSGMTALVGNEAFRETDRAKVVVRQAVNPQVNRSP